MKKIVIIRGNEFKVYDNDIQQNEDIFKEIYDKAEMQKKQIEDYTKNLLKLNEDERIKNPEYLNNIIVFCGERGQGKSTAMRHFSIGLMEEQDKEVLRVIDPTTMEMEHDIVDIIVSRLFDDFREKRNEIGQEKDMKLTQIFQKVHRDISVLKNAKKFIEKDYAYNASIQSLSDIADGMKMQKDIINLVELYLKYVKPGKDFLVIPIDDLDLNLNHAYNVMEQLRKYFMIPRVIIIMAANIAQLTLCIEKELYKKLKVMENLNHWNIIREIQNMSNRYIEKLIPFSRRMLLPDIHALEEDGENLVEVIYKDEREIIIFDSKELGIEKGILKLISEKTGLIYVAKPNEIHPIIPLTLRELVNLVSLLGDLGDNQKKNLEAFEQYFYNIWVENNLSEQYVSVVREVAKTQLNTLQKDTFLCLYTDSKIQEAVKGIKRGMGGRPIRNGSRLNELISAIIELYEKIEGNEKRPSNGDIINCLRVLEWRNKSETSRFILAITTIFSIKMLKLNKMSGNSILYDFIGSDIWGEYRLIREEANTRKSRVKFEYSVKDFIESYNLVKLENFSVSGIKKVLSQEKLIKTLLFMGIFSNFKSEKDTNRELVSGNNVIASKAEFDLNQLFLSRISASKVAEKISANKWGINNEIFQLGAKEIFADDIFRKIVCNMEVIMSLAQYTEIHREIKEAAQEVDHYNCFFENVNTFLKELNEYIPSIHLLDGDLLNIYEMSEIIVQMKDGGKKQQEFEGKIEVPLTCKSNSKVSKLKANLIELEEYIKTQNVLNEYENYSELLQEQKLIQSMIEKMQDEEIGQDLAKRYNILRKKAIR